MNLLGGEGMTEKIKEENYVWVENLWEGVWLLKIEGGKLLGYLVKCDPCKVTENDEPYEEGLIPTFKEYSNELGLEPERVDCIFKLFENNRPMKVKK